MDSTEKAIASYLKIKGEIDAQRTAFKERESAAKAKMDELASFVSKQIGSANSINTNHGTAFRKTKDFVAVKDWEIALPWIISSNNTQLLNKAAGKDAVKEYMRENENALPPGIDYGTKLELYINNPVKKKSKSI